MKPPGHAIDAVEVEAAVDRPLEITVRFASVASVEDARATAREVAELIVDRLSVEIEASVGNPRHDSDGFTPSTGGTQTLTQSLGMSTSAFCVKVLGPQEIEGLRRRLESQQGGLPGERLFGTFRSAMRVRNPVDRFLCLYNIVLLKNGDNQGAVDRFIRSVEPAVAQTPSPRFNGVTETVYTRLRNEFAHVRPGTSFDRTRTEMEQNLAGMQTLAKKALLLP